MSHSIRTIVDRLMVSLNSSSNFLEIVQHVLWKWNNDSHTNWIFVYSTVHYSSVEFKQSITEWSARVAWGANAPLVLFSNRFIIICMWNKKPCTMYPADNFHRKSICTDGRCGARFQWQQATNFRVKNRKWNFIDSHSMTEALTMDSFTWADERKNKIQLSAQKRRNQPADWKWLE